MWKLLNLLPGRRRRMEDDLARELRYHIDRRVDDLMRGGLDEVEARRRVAIEFGGVTQVQDEVRDAWEWRWLANSQRDLQYAVRILRRRMNKALLGRSRVFRKDRTSTHCRRL